MRPPGRITIRTPMMIRYIRTQPLDGREELRRGQQDCAETGGREREVHRVGAEDAARRGEPCAAPTGPESAGGAADRVERARPGGETGEHDARRAGAHRTHPHAGAVRRVVEEPEADVANGVEAGEWGRPDRPRPVDHDRQQRRGDHRTAEAPHAEGGGQRATGHQILVTADASCSPARSRPSAANRSAERVTPVDGGQGAPDGDGRRQPEAARRRSGGPPRPGPTHRRPRVR